MEARIQRPVGRTGDKTDPKTQLDVAPNGRREVGFDPPGLGPKDTEAFQ